MQYALVIGQVIVVVFLAFHDWVPLGKLNNVAGLRAVDTTYTTRCLSRARRCDIGCSCVSHLHAPMNIMMNCAWNQPQPTMETVPGRRQKPLTGHWGRVALRQSLLTTILFFSRHSN
jgi:hypothetical protein